MEEEKEKGGKTQQTQDGTKCSKKIYFIYLPAWQVPERNVVLHRQCWPLDLQEGRPIRSAGQEKAC